jgi:hypothetical protein
MDRRATQEGNMSKYGLNKRHDEMKVLLANTAVIQTQGERAILTAMIRYLETIRDGDATTPLAPTHHE